MPYYLDQQAGTSLNTLQDFAPTGAQSFAAQVGSVWEGNPTVLAFDAARVAAENARGERLSAYDAGRIATEAGLRDFAPGDGEYTRAALDMVIERKRQERTRQDVIDRTPWSWTGTPLRGLGMLGAAVLDPLNVGSAFVPVVGEARYLALLKGASGGLGRAAVRAGAGVAEGAVGMAMLEPLIYGAHQYLDDDYTMRDSLLNIAFGGALGGGLHVVAGRIGDALAPGKWDRVATIEEAHAQPELPRPRTDMGEPAPGSAAEAAAMAAPEVRHEVLRVAVGQMAEGRTVMVDPIMPRAVVGLTDDEARAAAIQELLPTLRAELADRVGDVDLPALERMRSDLLEQIDTAEALIANTGSAREAGGVFDPLLAAQAVQRTRGHIAAVEDAIQANMDDAALAQGYIPPQFEGRVAQRAQELQAGMRQRPLAAGVGAAVGQDAPVRALTPGEATPERMRPILLTENLRAAAAKQAAPESSITADFAAARAADERLAAAPKSADEATATRRADEAVERVRAAFADMKAAGAPAEVIERFEAMLKEADQAVADAEALGRAVEAAAVCGVARA